MPTSWEKVSMTYQHIEGMSRREFLSGLTLAGTTGFLGLHPRPAAADLPPETTRLRRARN